MYGNRIVAYGLVHTHAKAHVNPSIINGDIRGGGPNRPPPVVGRPKKVGGNRVKAVMVEGRAALIAPFSLEIESILV